MNVMNQWKSITAIGNDFSKWLPLRSYSTTTASIYVSDHPFNYGPNHCLYNLGIEISVWKNSAPGVFGKASVHMGITIPLHFVNLTGFFLFLSSLCYHCLFLNCYCIYVSYTTHCFEIRIQVGVTKLS